tara:strand:+ start:602 stop:2422 length:1821 start_codon:yes stop_codon:yes gene_type:complete
MCGIVGYVGNEACQEIILGSLERLEYRGYDSSGIATIGHDQLQLCRAVGKLSELKVKIKEKPVSGYMGIGHIRWATHGGVTQENAHPHLANSEVAIVHNGIIENYAELKKDLIEKGCVFISDTDSEVLAHLFAHAVREGCVPVEALRFVLSKIEGAFAFAAISKSNPETLMVARNASPLAIGFADEMAIVASDATAMAHLTRQVTYLKDNDYAVITAKSCDIFNGNDEPANREIVQVKASPILLDKAGFRHYMEKEIHEQPDAISHTISAMSDVDSSLTAGLDVPSLLKIKRIVLLAAGTSFYAAQIGRYWIEKLSGIPVVCEIASEYHYRDPAATGQTTAIAISQSGESIDTLMAMRHAKTLGLDTFGIVNVADSTIAREADKVLPTRAGPEIGVASTKAFTAQMIVLICLAIVLGRQNGHLDESRVTYLYQKLLKIPGAVGKSMKLFEPVRPIAHQLKNARSCLFLGRDMLFPLACEGALKLKELSYIHAEGFASGEMKHGPIALLEDGLPIVSFVSEDEMVLKAISNLKEAEARGGYIIVIGTQAAVDLIDFAAAKIVIPDCEPIFAPIVSAIPAQILAYLTALEKGTDIDQPRNLAKSVTVE